LTKQYIEEITGRTEWKNYGDLVEDIESKGYEFSVALTYNLQFYDPQTSTGRISDDGLSYSIDYTELPTGRIAIRDVNTLAWHGGQCSKVTPEDVERTRRAYPPGTVVEVAQPDPRRSLIPGDRGTVRGVDAAGTVIVDWDSGSKPGIVYGVNSVRKTGEVSMLAAINAELPEAQTVPPNRRQSKGAER